MAQFSDDPAACVGGEQGLKESLISFCSAAVVSATMERELPHTDDTY